MANEVTHESTTKNKRKKNKKVALPHATDWKERHIDDWNTTTFHAYLADKHEEVYGITYVPMRSWQVEKGLLGNYIGTARKKGTHDKAIVKAWIDECFRTHKASAQYPGLSFGFIAGYKKYELQRVEGRAKEERVAADKIAEWKRLESESSEDIIEWF